MSHAYSDVIPSDAPMGLAGLTPAALLDAVMRFVPSGITIAAAPDVTILRTSDYGAAMLQRPKAALENIAAEILPDAYRVYRADTGEKMTAAELPLTRAVRDGEVVQGEECLVINAAGERIPVLCNAGPIRDDAGRIVGGVIAWADLRAQKRTQDALARALEVNERLYRESHHRTKNNLQIVAALIALEARRRGPEFADFARELTARLGVFSSVHDSLYRADAIGRLDTRAYLENVCAALASDDRPARVAVDDGLEVGLDQATAVGMLVNEAVTNALKHAYPAGSGPTGSGAVAVSLRRDGDAAVLTVRDWGRGPPAATDGAGYGLKLIAQLAAQLGGRHRFGAAAGGGAELVVTFPLQGPAQRG